MGPKATRQKKEETMLRNRICFGAQSYWSESDGSDVKDYFREILVT